MLLNDFFHISSIQNENSEVKAGIIFNKGHKIFEGHFPGQPVVPGVCMMQMIKEIMETVLSGKTNLTNVSEMKFLAIIDPVKNNRVDAILKYSIEENKIKVSASLMKKELIHFKFKGQFEMLV
ncbi:MAG TPA: hypothetical protein VK498_00460 [Ferruginibacter sp.]|nr:hypothetical protein [Ferruginibacter sp.]